MSCCYLLSGHPSESFVVVLRVDVLIIAIRGQQKYHNKLNGINFNVRVVKICFCVYNFMRLQVVSGSLSHIRGSAKNLRSVELVCLLTLVIGDFPNSLLCY